ncbi:MAG TPA: potassium transporter TrkG [Ignavibacteriales bacterium]|nr:potassium transporter TrkG [Ignavibacteriales bacterium]
MNNTARNFANKISKLIIFVTSIIGLSAIIIEYGFNVKQAVVEVLHTVSMGVIVIFVLYQFFQVIIAEKKSAYIRNHIIEFIIILLIFIEIISLLLGASIVGRIGVALNLKNAAFLYIIFVQLFIVIGLFAGGLRYNKVILSSKIHPARLFVLSFVFTILIGALFLSLPRSTTGGHIPFIDALFTSTSAVCVTGLVVVDTATYYTQFGQTVILILIQIGGLGLMTFTTFFTLFLSGGLGIKESFVLGDMMEEENIGELSRILSFLIIITFSIELIGAAILFASIYGTMPFDEALFSSIFHSISAFCNAGFSLFSLNLFDPTIKTNYVFTTTISLLIILGGIGFPTIINLSQRGRAKDISKKLSNRITLQTKIVVLVTAVLIIGGTIGTYYLEYNHSLKGLDQFAKIHGAYFQSVVSRTAGYNSVDISKFTDATSMFYCFLMFVGASPGGTGGGIKTTTFAVLVLSFWAYVRNSRSVSFGKRTIPKEVILRSLFKTLFTLLLIFIAVFILTLTDKGKHVIDLTFEAFSAFATVGLSKGITSALTVSGKAVIILLMLIGRVGPLTFVYNFVAIKKDIDYDYPSENISTL